MSIENLKIHIHGRIAEAGRKAFGQEPEGLEIGFPPDMQLGHLAVGCFPLSKRLRKSPAEIAKTLAVAIPSDEVIESAAAAGPYINFRSFARPIACARLRAFNFSRMCTTWVLVVLRLIINLVAI